MPGVVNLINSMVLTLNMIIMLIFFLNFFFFTKMWDEDWWVPELVAFDKFLQSMFYYSLSPMDDGNGF